MGVEAMVAVAALKGLAGMAGAKSQAKGLAQQASMARMQGTQEELKYKQQGVNVLKNVLKTQASITARAAAGGLDPFSGSAASLGMFALAQGADELYTGMDNAKIAVRASELQAEQYMAQAKGVMQAAKLAMITDVAMAGAQGAQLGGAPSTGTMGQGSGAYLRTGATSSTAPTFDPFKMVFS